MIEFLKTVGAIMGFVSFAFCIRLFFVRW